MPSKCPFFDRGFCKKKNKCTEKHPPQDCDGECEDLNTCPNRHRIECKNGISCLFLKIKSCEFLHPETWAQEVQPNSEEETLRIIHEEYGMRITSIEESTNNIKSLKSKFLNKIVILEGELSELKNKSAFENKTSRESQNAALRTSHRLSMCQVVFT